MYTTRTISSQAVAVEQTAAKLPAMLALIFGAFLVFGAGFAHSSTIHNAAHDTRHAVTAPCH